MVGSSERLRSRHSRIGFLDRLLSLTDLHPEIPNAIALSFVEPESLQASTMGRQLWSEMPTPIRNLVAGPVERRP